MPDGTSDHALSLLATSICGYREFHHIVVSSDIILAFYALADDDTIKRLSATMSTLVSNPARPRNQPVALEDSPVQGETSMTLVHVWAR
jgi:hypothetical protein